MDDAQREDFGFARNVSRDEDDGAVFAEATCEGHGEACENRRPQRREDDAAERIEPRRAKAGCGLLFGRVEIFDDGLQRPDDEGDADEYKRDENAVDAVGDFDAQRLKAGSDPAAGAVEAADGDARDGGRQRERQVDPKFQEFASREVVSRKSPCYGKADDCVEKRREKRLPETDLEGGDGFGGRQDAAELLRRQLRRPDGEGGHRQQDQHADVGHADAEEKTVLARIHRLEKRRKG